MIRRRRRGRTRTGQCWVPSGTIMPMSTYTCSTPNWCLACYPLFANEHTLTITSCCSPRRHLPLDHWTAHSWILRCLLGYFRLPRLWLSPCSRLVEFNQLHGNICTMDPLLTIATSPWSVATHVTPSRGVIMLTQQVLGAFESDVASLLLLFY